MDNKKKNLLKTGTLLHGKYRIKEELGSGGFGITYLAEDIEAGENVAVKELLCRDYLTRSAENDEVILLDESDRARFEHDKRRVLREARIISRFTNETGVVKVFDCFEQNNTAYIAMEYLHGTALRDYVKKNGRIKPKQLFEEIRPLMDSLEAIHKAGVIHRDINPNNIIRTEDGTLILIDFGSAKNTDRNTQTVVNAFTEGFAPPEQYNSSVKPSRTMDIYSLSATIYYCLTGTYPVSSLQRVLFDELKTPEELGCAVPPEVSDMIMQGMSPLAENRQKSVRELTDVLEKFFPVLSDEEKLQLQRRKKTAIISAAAVILAAVCLLSAHVIKNRTYYYLKMNETEKVYLFWDGISDDERDQSADVIKKRMDVFAGSGRYSWTDDPDNNKTTVEFPKKLLQDQDVKYVFDCYITNQLKDLYLTNIDKGDPKGDLQFSRSDIVTVEKGEGPVPVTAQDDISVPYTAVQLKTDIRSPIKDLLNKRGTHMILKQKDDDGNMIESICLSSGDGTSFYVVSGDTAAEDDEMNSILGERRDDKLDETEKGTVIHAKKDEPFRDLLKFDLENAPPEKSPFTYAGHSVEWEAADNDATKGSLQLSEADLEERSYNGWRLIKYDIADEDYDKAKLAGTIAVLKERLDNYISYSIGNDSERSIFVKVPDKTVEVNLDGNTAAMLCADGDTYLSDGKNEIRINIYPDQMESVEDYVEFEDDYLKVGFDPNDKAAVEQLISKAQDEGSKKIYFCLGPDGKYPCAYSATGDIGQDLDDNKLSFTHGCFANPDDERCFKEFYIKEILETEMPMKMQLSEIVYYDEKGNVRKAEKYEECRSQGYNDDMMGDKSHYK